MMHLPQRSVAVPLSSLHAQRNDAANYTCPSVCLSVVAADGSPSSAVRGEGRQPRLYSLHGVTTELRKGAAVKFCFPLWLYWRKGRGRDGCHGSQWRVRGSPSCSRGNKAFCGLTCSQLKEWIWKSCRCNSGVFEV